MSGASGLVGSRFVELFSGRYEVANLDLTNNVDITDLQSVKQFISSHPATTLIHLAAFTNTREAERQIGETQGLCYQVNVTGTENIAKVCRVQNIHLVHVSTDFVFDGTQATAYHADSPRRPLGWYGTTKALAEEAVEGSGASYTIVRLAYPYRANFPAKPDIVAKLRAGIKDGTLPPQFSDTIITPTLVDDIARGFDILINSPTQGIFHFTGSSSLSPYELALKVAQAYGFDPTKVPKGSLAQYLEQHSDPLMQYSRLDNSKARNQLGLQFATIEQGLQTILRQQAL